MSETKETTLFETLEKETKKINEIHKNGTYTTEIESVVESTSDDFYGASEYETQKGFDVLTKSGVREFYPVNPVYGFRGKIGKFIAKYGSPPKKGMTVTVDISGEFETIVIF